MTFRSFTRLLPPLAVALLVAACAAHETPRPDDEPDPAAPIIPVEPIERLGVLDAFNAIIGGGAFNERGVPPVILELKDAYDSRGHFTLGAQYAGWDALARHLASLDATYVWTVEGGDVLVGRPAVGALLDRPLGPT